MVIALSAKTKKNFSIYYQTNQASVHVSTIPDQTLTHDHTT